ncbi:TPA: hypothetical protein ACVO35_004171 [Vibrio alginolyticus]|uniref:hypothetical protein n=1 Tax=Vibrio alginolyticus TaxID=663 RepID=UPI0007AA31D3|nr:hypothetical protein [Vibrio alginolyticus]KZC46056.1 hypothetical protein XM68_c12656 [Vibrio alginolyticus]
MSDFTAIGQLVTEARSLLDSIKGGAIRKMQTEYEALKANIQSAFNSKLAGFDAQVAAATKPTADLTSKFMLSHNVRALDLVEGTNIPQKWSLRAQADVVEQMLITNNADRSAIQNAMLAELHSDIREVYPTFNGSASNHLGSSVRAIRVTWDFSAQPDIGDTHIIIPIDKTSGSPLFLNQLVTHAAFVKCISGEISLQDADVKTVGTKWTWLRRLYVKSPRFGNYIHPCLVARTPVGEAWILLPGHAAGNITDPNDWMGLPEF